MLAAEQRRHRQPDRSLVLVSRSAGQTRALGRELGRSMVGSEVVALVGPLGAGKTCLVQGVGRGLAVREAINSPSFVLMKRYRGRVALIHWDWYRLTTEADLETTGYGDVQGEQGVVVIEWADRFLDRVPPPFLLIEMALAGARTRRLRMRVQGRSARLDERLRSLHGWWVGRYGDTRRDAGTGD